VPPERHVDTGRLVHADRSDKHGHDGSPTADRPRGEPPLATPDPNPSHRRRPGRRTLTVVGAGVAAAAVITTVFLVTRPSGSRATGITPTASAAAGPSSTASPSPSTSASAVPASDTATAGASSPSLPSSAADPSSTAAPSSVSVPSPAPPAAPAGLDPLLITGYSATLTYSRYEPIPGNTNDHHHAGEVLGDYQYNCTGSVCDVLEIRFPAAVPSFSGSRVNRLEGAPASPCDPVMTWNFIRDDQGNYTGTRDSQPKKAIVRSDGGIVCASNAWTYQVVLTPITSG
jgi:hypothetical protein